MSDGKVGSGFGLGRWLGERCKEEPAFALTLGYLTLTLIGMTYQQLFFWRFHIPILQYSDISDFLLAAIREPVVILYSLLSVAIMVLLRQWDQKARRLPMWAAFYAWYVPRFERTRRQRQFRAALYTLIVPLYFYAFTLIYATYKAQQISEGKGQKVVVQLSNDVPNTKAIQQNDPYSLLLGTTSRFVFFYQPATQEVEIVPLESIGRLVSSVPEIAH